MKETDRQLREKDDELEKMKSRILWLERQQTDLFKERIQRETLIKSPAYGSDDWPAQTLVARQVDQPKITTGTTSINPIDEER